MSRLSLLFSASLLIAGFLCTPPITRSGEQRATLPIDAGSPSLSRHVEVSKPDTPISRLRTGETAQRRAAAEWLNEHPTPQADNALLVALNDSEPDVIWWAASALAKLKNPGALEPLRLASRRPGR